jgi:methyl-accepting chemotaxis protein
MPRLPWNRKRREEAHALVAALIRLVMVDAEIALSLRFNAERMRHGTALRNERETCQDEARALLEATAQALENAGSGHGLPQDAPEAYGEVIGAPWESLQYYPLRDFWRDGKQMISA